LLLDYSQSYPHAAWPRLLDLIDRHSDTHTDKLSRYRNVFGAVTLA